MTSLLDTFSQPTEWLSPSSPSWVDTAASSSTPALSSFWDGLGGFITKGLGVWGEINRTNAQTDLAKAQIEAQRQQANTQSRFWQALQQYIPAILLGGLILVAAVILLRRK